MLIIYTIIIYVFKQGRRYVSNCMYVPGLSNTVHCGSFPPHPLFLKVHVVYVSKVAEMINISFTLCLRDVTLQNRSVKIFQQLLIELGDEETLYIQSNF